MNQMYPRIIHGQGGKAQDMAMTVDGLENKLLWLGPQTLGTGNETVTIDSDQNALIMGPVTFNCSLAINGSLKVI